MFVHIAIYRWNDGVTTDQIAEALATVKSLESLVPGVQRILVGENYSKWNQGFTHGIVVIGETQDAIDRYRAHPVHADVAATIEAMEADGIGFDFHDESAS